MTNTPCPSNPLGVKGCGEAGAIAAPAAVINAITDALDTRTSPCRQRRERCGKAAQKSPTKMAAE
jgi:carbon-monoxide dehydrogenase large subunit